MTQISLNRSNLRLAKTIFRRINKSLISGILIAAINLIVISAIVLSAIMPEQYDLKVGDILQTPISAPRDVENVIATQRRIKEAMENVSPIYRYDESINETVLEDINRIFNQIQEVRALAIQKLDELEQSKALQQLEENIDEESINPDVSNGNSHLEDKDNLQLAEAENKNINIDRVLDTSFINELQDKLDIMLSKDEILTCIMADEDELRELKEQLTNTLSRLLELRIKQDNLLEAKSTLREEIMSLPISNEVRLLGTSIGTSILKPNMIYDHEATEEEKQKKAEQVEKVMYKRGQHIVQAGQPITEEQYAVLQELGLLKGDKVDVPFIVGLGLTIFIIQAIVALYLIGFEKEIVSSPTLLFMISLIIWMTLGLSRVVSELNIYLIPAALAGMLITVLLKPRPAIVINMAIAVMLGIMMEGHLGIVIMAVIAGTGGIFIASRTHQRNGLMLAGVAVSCINLLAIAGYEMLSSGAWIEPLKTSLWGVGSGMLSAIFLVGTLPIWENIFGIVTPIKLVELSNPNHPLLRRLLREAPGTYHHSVIVANLAENAAEAIGANGLLARVGAYYHDTGKLQRPFYFRENQLTGKNPHDKLNPTLSTHIIISHAKDGVEIAKKYRIPKVIQDFIQQHHGTTPVIYFYHKAKSQDKCGDVHLDNFRYPGPKPQIPEIAIVMMADTVEAAVRAMTDPTSGKIEALIRKLIKEKLEDGQLDECNLTLKDLNKIANAFTEVMTGVFHERVEYPDVNLKEDQELKGEPINEGR